MRHQDIRLGDRNNRNNNFILLHEYDERDEVRCRSSYLSNALISRVANLECSIKTPRNAGKSVKLSFDREAAITCEPRNACATEISYRALLTRKRRGRS